MNSPDRDPNEIADELEELKREIEERTEEAYRLLRDAPGRTREAARGYWYAHIKGALSDDSGFLGGSMTNMEDTIRTLREWGELPEDQPEDRPA